MRDRDVAALHPGPWAEVLVFAAVYLSLAALSLSTAYLQVNAAAVWIPSGFAVGLLVARGNGLWPAVALGSFAANLWVNLGATPSSGGVGAIVAACVAAGNTAEALLGAYLARRFASGADFLYRPRDVASFVLLVAPLPPLVSTTVGVAVSAIGGLSAESRVPEVILTWYVANTVGILVFAGLTVMALSRRAAPLSRHKVLEAALLTVTLVFIGQAICGIYVAEALADWPKAYMVIPLLLWASFRFGPLGAQLSIVLITLISVAGTMRGFQAFPADTPSRALLYLQIFLGMLSTMTLVVSSALSEVHDLTAGLEDKVRARTRDIEQLLREREVFTTLVAHDLQSPIFGVRNALRAAAASLKSGRIANDELIEAMRVMEETCATLAQRVASLLAPARDATTTDPGGRRAPLADVVGNIAAVHRIAMNSKGVRLRVEGDMKLEIAHPAEVEHILDILVDNAARHAPRGSEIELAAFRHGASVEILVTDRGPGLSREQAKSVFLPRSRPQAGSSGAGVGLYLASEQAGRIGGRLTYADARPTGARFRLVVPA